MMDFIKKHLPEQPYIEGIQRFSLRDKILREVALNLIIHREYSSAYPTTFTIYRDRIVTENWNIPYVYGTINLQTMRPHRKNPKIANVFSQMGIVEELGSGIRKMFKYTPLYANGKEPIIEEQDVYRIDESGKKTGKKTGKELEDVIKEAIRKDSSITIQEFQKLTGLSKNGIWNVLNRMKEQNKIKRIGPDKGGHWEVVEE